MLLQLTWCCCVAGMWDGCKSYTSSCDRQAIWRKVVERNCLVACEIHTSASFVVAFISLHFTEGMCVDASLAGPAEKRSMQSTKPKPLCNCSAAGLPPTAVTTIVSLQSLLQRCALEIYQNILQLECRRLLLLYIPSTTSCTNIRLHPTICKCCRATASANAAREGCCRGRHKAAPSVRSYVALVC